MADFAGLVIGIDGDTTALQKAVKDGADAVKQFAKDAESARRIINGSSSAYDRYNTAMERLNQLHRDGHLSSGQLANAQEKLARELQDATGQTTRLSQEMRRAEQITRSLETAEEKLARETAELSMLHKSGAISAETYARGLDRVDKEARGLNDEMGEKGPSRARQFGIALGVLGTAVATLRQGFQGLREDAERGLAAAEKIRGGNQNLAQIAGSADELKRMEMVADGLAVRFGISRQDARELLFSAKSAGVAEGGGLSTMARASTLLEKDATARVAGQFTNLFKGAQDVSVNQALSGAMVAAQDSLFTFEELSLGAPSAAEAAAGAGTSAEETLALLSVLSDRFPSTQTTGDRIKAFSSKVAQTESLRGLGVVGAFEALRAMDPEDRKEILKDSQELNAVYDILSKDIDEVIAKRKQIEEDFRATAAGGGALARQLQIQESSASFRLGRDRVSAEVKAEIELEREGLRLEAARALADEIKADQAKGGLSGERFLTGTVDKITEGITGRTMTEMVVGGSAERMVRAAEEQVRLTRMMLEKQDQMVEERRKEALANPQRFNEIEQVF